MKIIPAGATGSISVSDGSRCGAGVEAILALGAPAAVAVRPAAAADALLKLAGELPHVRDRELAERLVAAGRRLATPEAVNALLDTASAPATDVRRLAAALRFHGPEIAATILHRMSDTPSLTVPRRYYSVATSLAEYAEIRGPMVALLNLSLEDERWFVVRNAVLLLAGIGASLPLEHLWGLARARHRQVRLALAQVIARWKPNPDGLDLLTALLDDEDPGVRFASATALRPYAHPRARQALARRAARETDPDTKTACAVALSRHVVALRSA